jgi:hypothetical protein
MNNYNATMDYEELVSRLKQHCRDKVTGTIFIKSDSANLARFIISKGVIASCVYRHKSGYDAIPLLRSIRSGSFRFSDHPVEGMKFPPMPDTREFFDLLSEPNPDAASAQCTPAPNSRTKVPPSIQNDPSLIAIKSVLKNYIGPMADIVCNHYLDNKTELLHPSRYEDLIKRLAENIGSDTERSAFIQTALSRIKRA